MQGEARQVARLDLLRERGWKFVPNSDDTWNVFLPKSVQSKLELQNEPERGLHGLVEALAWAMGVERTMEWLNQFEEYRAPKAD